MQIIESITKVMKKKIIKYLTSALILTGFAVSADTHYCIYNKWFK